MWRIRDRRTFQELRRRGRRVRSGTVTVTMLPLPSPAVEPPRLAFAIPRTVGPAVERNRLRRRIRAHLVERRRTDRFPGGAWLVALRPGAAQVDPHRLLADVDTCIDRALAGPAGEDGAGR